MRFDSRHAARVATATASLLALLVLPGLAPMPSRAAVALSDGHEQPLPTRLSAAFYSDASCLLRIDQLARVGSTLIDATLGDGVSRTLIHCDTEDGRRLTLLARGVTLGQSERARLLERDSVERGADGIIAWLTQEGTNFPDESAPRRYLSTGEVFIREAPMTQTAGAAPHADHRAFALVEGELESQLAHPDELMPPVD